MPFHSPRNRSSGGFSCFRPGCNARLSSVVCRLPTLPRRSVRPFRAFAVLSAMSCRLRLSVACSVLQSAHLSDPVCLCLVLQGSFLSGIPCTQCRYGRITYFSAFLSCSMVSFAGVIPPGHASVYFGRRKKFQI